MRRNYYKYLLGIMALLLLLSGCRNQEASDDGKAQEKLTASELSALNKELAQKEQERIESYIRRHSLKMKMTDTGLWYHIIDEGIGEKARAGDVLRLRYSCSLLDGTMVYHSQDDGLKEFTLGYGNVETGLNEACAKLAEGGKGLFILPPHLAHGLLGDDHKIPARATLVYEIEVESIH